MNVKRILVVKLRHLGDVLLSSPVFTNLRAAYPDAKIDAYVWDETEAMLLGHPAIDEILCHPRKWKQLPFFQRYTREFNLLRSLRKKSYDLVINLTEGDRGALVAKFSGAKVRVGVRPKKKWAKSVYTHLVKPCPTDRHTVERDLDALRKLGHFPEYRDLTYSIPEDAKERMQKLVGDEPFVVIHGVSRWRFKCPPAELMARVASQLGMRVILTGAPSEKAFVEEIEKKCCSAVLNFAGKTSLKEMGALLALSRGLITVDSVSLHMASALKVPVVALFGPTSEKNWGPWRHPSAKVVAGDLPCRPCRLDGCGGSKMSDCLWTLSPDAIVEAFYEVASAGAAADISSASLRVLNSFEMNLTE